MVVPFRRGAVAAFAVVLASCSAPAGPAFRGATDIDRAAFAEPSGIAFHPTRGTLFVVGDEGSVLELRRDGEPVAERWIGDVDLEGVTCVPATGLVYVVEEGRDRIHELDPDTLEVLRWFEPETTFEGRAVLVRNDAGLEGITFVADADHPEGGTFFVVNQNRSSGTWIDDPSALVEVELPLTSGRSGDAAPIRAVLTPGVGDLSGIHYDAASDEFLVVTDRGDSILRIARDGRIVASWPIGGDAQEGLTIDDAGRAFLADDAGGIFVEAPRSPGGGAP